MLEALIIAPVVFILLAGILEFGAFLVYKLEVETGLRDAARYVARCQTSGFPCDDDTAKEIAVFGVPNPAVGARVPGWDDADVQVQRLPVTNNEDPVTGLWDFRGPDPIIVVRVQTTFDYPGGPLLDFVGLGSIPIFAYHEERYIGW